MLCAGSVGGYSGGSLTVDVLAITAAPRLAFSDRTAWHSGRGMPRSITLGCLHRGAGQNRRLVVLSERSLLSRPVFSVLAARLRDRPTRTAAIPAEKRYCLMRRRAQRHALSLPDPVIEAAEPRPPGARPPIGQTRPRSRLHGISANLIRALLSAAINPTISLAQALQRWDHIAPREARPDGRDPRKRVSSASRSGRTARSHPSAKSR